MGSGHSGPYDLVNKLSQIRVDEDESLISFDVSALFTSVPVEESLTLIHEKLAADPYLADRSALSPQQVTDLRMCLTPTYFKYDGNFYAQIEGAAMGSLVSPIVANLFMEDYEGKALEAYQDPPKYRGRPRSDQNSAHRAIHTASERSTHKHSVDQRIGGRWETPHARHPDHQNDGWVTQVQCIQKADTHWSVPAVPKSPTYGTQDGCHQNTDTSGGYHNLRPTRQRTRNKHLKKVLSVAGYSKWAWQAPGRKKIRPHPRNTDSDRAKGHVTLPYIWGVTEPISRLIRKTGVAAHAKPHTTIRSILVTVTGPRVTWTSPTSEAWRNPSPA